LRTTKKQVGAISLGLVLGAILMTWTTLLAATSEPAGAQTQDAESEEIRLKGRGGNELVVTADRVTITSDDVVVTKEARNTGQAQSSSNIVSDRGANLEPKTGSDESATSPEDSPAEEPAPGGAADVEDSATEGERGTPDGDTTLDSSPAEESLSERGVEPEALLRMALEECAVVVSEDENVPDNDTSEESPPEETTTPATSTTDEAADVGGPPEESEEAIYEEQRDSDKEATPVQTPEIKSAQEKEDGKTTRHAKKALETIPIANEDPTGPEEVAPEETTTRETTGEATTEEAEAEDSTTDVAPTKETTATQETATEEKTTRGESASEREDGETERTDGPALGLTQDDCEKMLVVIAEYNELYATPTEYDNDENAQREATLESEPVEGESTGDDYGAEGEYPEDRTGEGTAPGGASREERLARRAAAGTQEAVVTEEVAREEANDETTSPSQGSERGSGFAFSPEEEPEEGDVAAPPEGERVSGDDEGRATAPTEPPGESQTTDGEDAAVGAKTSERPTTGKTTTGTAKETPDSSSWGQRSSTPKNTALPEQKTTSGTRAELPRTGGPSVGALAPVAALTAGLPLGAILGVLSLGAGTVLVGFARYRRGWSSGNGRDGEDEGECPLRDG
jgi:hypothetical protein